MRSLFIVLLGSLSVLASADVRASGFGGLYENMVETSRSIGNGDTLEGPVTPVATPDVTAPDTTTPTNETAPAAKRSCQPPCYDTKNPKSGGCPKAQCVAFEKSNPNYFSNIDRQCQLPAGTAITMGGIESTCNAGAAGTSGTYRGMFQFSSSSCTRGNLHSPAVQAQCMCDYTASTRSQYQKATGKLPSAGMYYLMHQQGGCGMKLALGGGARAVDVVSQCVSKSMCGGSGGCAKSMRYAMRAIKGNIPNGSGYNADSVSASQFANIYLSKFSHIDNNNVCMGDGEPSDMAGGTSPLDLTSDSAIAAIVKSTGALTGDGSLLSDAFVRMILTTPDISSLFSPLFNPNYLDENADEDEQPDSSNEVSVDIVENDDGSKTVAVSTSKSSTTYTVGVGKQLWVCGSTYRVEPKDEAIRTALEAKGCKLVTEAAAVTP